MKAYVIRTSQNYPGGGDGYYVEVNTIDELLAIDKDGDGLIVEDYRGEGYDFDLNVEIYDDYRE